MGEGLFAVAGEVRLGVDQLFTGPRETLGSRLAERIVARWTMVQGEDPLMVLLRAAGERGEAAESLSAFLDKESLEPCVEILRRYGVEEHEAISRARAIDIFILGISMRLRVLRNDLGDPAQLREWMGTHIQRLVDGTQAEIHSPS